MLSIGAAVSRTLFAVILLAGPAGAALGEGSFCGEGCLSEGFACRLASKATAVACKASCGIAADAATVRACRRECLSEYRLARDACTRERRESCLPLCDDSSVCIQACGEQLRRCAAALGKRGRPCRRLCKRDPAVIACRAACLDAWVGGCRGGVQQCAADCTTTTTVTTTTTTSIVDCTSNPAGGPDMVDVVVTDHGTDLDVGWTGVDHNFPFAPNATLRMCLSTCGPDGTPPCGMLGMVGAGEPNGTTFGPPLPLLAANVPICIVNEWNATIPPTGTVDPLTGDANVQVNLISKVHLTTATQVCPRCNNGKCDSGPNQGKNCVTDGTLVVTQSLGANKVYNLSPDCPPDPGALAAPLDIRLPMTTGTAMLAGPTPCTAQPGQPMGTPVHDDNCNGGGCGAGNCTATACVSMGTDPSTGAPICMDSKGGLSQSCCNNDTTKSCFPTAAGAIVRMGKPFPPSPPFPDQTYPKTGNGVLAAVFCVSATGVNSIDTTVGAPGPGALLAPVTATWHRAPGG